MNSGSLTPKRKVGAGALAGAVTTLIILVLKYALPNVAIDGVSAAAITTILTFIVSYFVPEEDNG